MNKAIQEREVTTLPGMLMVLLLLVFAAAAGWWVLASIKNLLNPVLPIVVLVFILFLWGGFFIVQPNQAAVLQFFGKFVGVERNNGLRWANPLYSKKSVTLRVRNFESSKLKVNDLEGIADRDRSGRRLAGARRAEAVFNVDSYEDFVHVQSEAALRRRRPAIRTICRRSARSRCVRTLARSTIICKREIQERLERAGVTVHGSARQPPRLRTGDRAGDAATSAGRRDNRRAHAHRRRRGQDGAHGARTSSARKASCSSTKSARPRWFRTCSSCCAASAARSRS